MTIPKRVREALDLAEGDALVFRVERSRAVVARTSRFLDLAGSVTVPPGKQSTAWNEIVSRTRAERAKRR